MVSSPKDPTPARKRRPPATTPEGRENQLVALAYDEAEKRILAGTATSQLLTHFLKQGTPRERLERTKIGKEVELLSARADAIASGKKIEELYGEAITAFKSYQGQDDEELGDA